MSEATYNLIISGLMGIMGGIITIPLNAFVNSRLKKQEQLYQHKLDMISKRREQLRQHFLEMQRQQTQETELSEIKALLYRLQKEGKL